jgi:hypothetical protein
MNVASHQFRSVTLRPLLQAASCGAVSTAAVKQLPKYLPEVTHLPLGSLRCASSAATCQDGVLHSSFAANGWKSLSTQQPCRMEHDMRVLLRCRTLSLPCVKALAQLTALQASPQQHVTRVRRLENRRLVNTMPHASLWCNAA